MSTRTYTGLLVLMLLLALIPRLWLWDDQGRAGMVYPGDQDEYYRGAIHILLERNYYDEGQWLRPPVTSFFLAAIFALAGVNVPLAMLVQCFVSAATLLLLAESARCLFESRRAGVAAAFLAAIFLPYASYASQLFSETLHICTTAAALLLFEVARRSGMRWQWLLAGSMVWGFAALTRPVGVYALPLLMLWAGVARRDDDGSGKGLSLSWGRWSFVLSRALAVLAGFVLVVGPWSIRNYMVYEQVVLVDTNGGISFWLGNLIEPGERELQGVWNRTIPNLAEREDVAMARALENIQREPLLFLQRMRYKTVSLWQLDTRLFVSNAPIGITLDEYSLPFAVASDVQYVVIMLLAIGGIVLSRPSERNLVMLGWPLYGTLLSAVSLGHPRLRLPLMVVLIVYAALPLAHPRLLWQRLRTARWYRKVLVLAGVGMFAFLIYASAYISFVQSQAWVLRSHLASGGEREHLLQRAIEAAPDNYLPYLALGDFYRDQGDVQAALDAYNQAAHRAPQNSYTHLQRLDLYRQVGDRAGAQAAMDAIAAVGWDNNQLYRWAWYDIPASAHGHLDAGDPAPGIVRGVYAAESEGEHGHDEPGGRVFRWTREHTHIRLGTLVSQQEGMVVSTLSLVLRADAPDTPVQVSFRHDSKSPPIETTLHVGTEWERFDIPVSSAGIGDGVNRFSGRLELRAPLHVASVDEPYPRGVALADCDLTRPALSPRSRLYALEPIGMGMPMVEGLVSYVMRLTAVHQVTHATL